MTLRRRLGSLALLLVVLLGLLGAVGIHLARSRARAAAVETNAGIGLEQSLQLKASYIDMETGERGFLLGGSDVFMEPFTVGAESVARLQGSLRRSGQLFFPQATNQLNQVVRAGDAWRARAGVEIRVRRQKGQGAATAMLATEFGKVRFDALRTELDGLSGILAAAQHTAHAQREEAARRLAGLLLAVPLAGLLFTGLTGLLLNRWVLRPMNHMVDAVRRVTAGELDVTVPASGAPDVAELGGSVDAMRRTIIDRLAEAEFTREQAHRAREAIEQNTVVALQLRAELASELGVFPDGWTAAADLLPAEGWVAGDCYDVTLVAPHLLGVIVLDIAGHGAAQALMALKCKEILRAALRVAMAPGDALNLLADQIGAMHPSFLTAFVALIDTTTGTCQYANAGHPPALLAPDGEEVVELAPTGPLLGVFTAQWDTKSVEIEPGGKLAVYTDGLVEARDGGRVFYGMERLAAMVITLPCAEAEPVIKACFDDLHSFSPERLVDDVTMVLVCRSCS